MAIATSERAWQHIGIKYHFQRQLLLDGVIRLQHQSTRVQVADILTKDLGRKVHRRHRNVLCGKVPIEIESVALPESQKLYIRRHNEELARRIQKDKLESEFKSVQKLDESKLESDSESIEQVLLAVVKLLVSKS